MVTESDSFLHKYKWHALLIFVILAAVGALTIFTGFFDDTEGSMLGQLILMLGALVFLLALLTLVSRVSRALNTLGETHAKLEEVTGALEKISAELTKINQMTRVSETAKAIVFRDADQQSLREAVFDRLQEKDFEGADELIEQIAQRPEYADLAEQLRSQAEHYHDSTDHERFEQVATHIEKLLDDRHWASASAQIESLIKAHPESERAKALRQSLIEKKQQRKKALLAAWDEAVKRQQTDRSLDILKELDFYLTPNEALALQEAARDVFRTKLHNLGVQFALAVTEKQWVSALDVGQQIINNFPNSKMSEEIRAKLSVLQQNVQLQNN